MEGKIDTLNSEKGFGFIGGDNKERYFFHKSDFNGYWNDLVIDIKSGGLIRVKFEGKNTPKGPRASDVSRLDFPNQVGG